MNEQKELRIKNYIYNVLLELATKPLNTVNTELLKHHLHTMTDDMFEYIVDHTK